jgi:putative oxidoreductase
MNGVLLLARLMMASCFIPAAVTRVSNISGFSYQLWVKGMPYPSAVAAAVAVIEVFGPLALVLGFAPRLTASVLVGATVITTGTLHRFWEVVGPSRDVEQALFVGHLGLVAGLLFYAVSGPGAWSWQTWWKGPRETVKPAKKPARSRSSKPRPVADRGELPKAA